MGGGEHPVHQGVIDRVGAEVADVAALVDGAIDRAAVGVGEAVAVGRGHVAGARRPRRYAAASMGRRPGGWTRCTA